MGTVLAEHAVMVGVYTASRYEDSILDLIYKNKKVMQHSKQGTHEIQL